MWVRTVEGICIIVRLKLGAETDGYAQAPKTFATATAAIDESANGHYSCSSYQGAGHLPMNIDERVRRARFSAVSKVQAVVDLEAAIAVMERTICALSQDIAAEEGRTRVVDRSRVTYSLAAKDAADRSQRLQKTITALKTNLHSVVVERDDALAQVIVLEATSEKKGVINSGYPKDESKGTHQRRVLRT